MYRYHFQRTCLSCVRRFSDVVEGTSSEVSSSLKGAKTVLTGERGINKVTLLGRAGQDAQVRGSVENSVTVFPLATSYTLKTREGEYVQKTEWHRISVFRPVLKDIVGQSVKKGDRVFVQGSISYSQYKDKTNAVQRATNILAEEVLNLSRYTSSGSMTEPHSDDQFIEEQIEAKLPKNK